MAQKKFIVAIDQGTTSCRSILIDSLGEICHIEQQEFTQHYPPHDGWVEHDPKEIWETQERTLLKLLEQMSVLPEDIVGLGITNQRETTVLWDRNTGEPLYNAIVWQDKRTHDYCNKIKDDGLEPYINANTGLVVDAYFCATKIQWILDHVKGAREKAEKGQVCFGTVDSWLLWKMTRGARHATDFTNASRTMLFNIQELRWDEKLLEAFNIPKSILPEVCPSAFEYGDFEYGGEKIKIRALAGDQQAALFGQTCLDEGVLKNTYGTGCFLLLNVGQNFIASESGLITTLACSLSEKPTYALEGSVFIAGAAVQWLRDGLKIIDHAHETADLAMESSDDRVVVVPAFAGLGAPYWNMNVRGGIFGLSRSTDHKSIVRATLQSIAYQTKDMVEAMEKDSKIKINKLMVDGGACANQYLMQFQSDLLEIPIHRPKYIESTALGVAYLAGIQAGIWTMTQIKEFRQLDHEFVPSADRGQMELLYNNWHKSVAAVTQWAES